MLRAPIGYSLALLAVAGVAAAKPQSPKDFFGHDVCEDYWLANYRQLSEYWTHLDKESDRLKLVSIGTTEEGREQYMCVISDPANLRNLDRHRAASKRIAMARDLTPETAERLIETAKPIVWIDGGLHATEVLGAQQLLETAWQLVSRNDPENRRILKDCIVLLAHANPDGMDLVSDWYMRRADPKARSLAGVPRLYQKYIGHDNNRDFYANNMKETQNINRVLYREWFPQIVYNHHQTAPGGTIMFIPPFRNPFNYHVDPLVQIATDVVGVHMHHRLISEGKGGTVMRSAANYSTWWNGGLRTTNYFHNIVGILTETFGSPNPTSVPFLNNRQIPLTDMPMPVDAGPWPFRNSLAYEVGANYAILDYASRYREPLLRGVYTMASNQVARGRKDTWTRYPSRIGAFGADALRRPDLRDAKMYVLPADQPDKGSVRMFLDRLMKCGVEVHQLTEPGTVHGKSIPAGSYVVRCDQPYRAHVLDMFEFQDHPNDFQYPGGPPIPPYDNAGYTLAFQMGVQFERVLDPHSLSLRPVSELPMPHFETLAERTPLADLDTYRRLTAHLRSGKPVSIVNGWAATGPNASSGLPPLSLGRLPRVGLWDRYGGSMPSGWTRWIFEQFGFDFTVLYPPDFDEGGLRDRFDAIVLPSGALPSALREPQGGGGDGQLASDATIPIEWRRRMGSMGPKALEALRQFVEQGGHLLAIGDSALNLTRHWDMPLKSALTETDEQGRERNLPNTKFYVPGSVLRVRLRPDQLTFGLGEEVDVLFDDSPAFRWKDPLDSKGAVEIARFDSDKPLRSGWAWGQAYLKDTIAIADVPIGKGRVVLFGPEVLFRAQPTQTFKLVFNGLFRSAAN